MKEINVTIKINDNDFLYGEYGDCVFCRFGKLASSFFAKNILYECLLLDELIIDKESCPLKKGNKYV